jgi:hypothetical protein
MSKRATQFIKDFESNKPIVPLYKLGDAPTKDDFDDLAKKEALKRFNIHLKNDIVALLAPHGFKKYSANVRSAIIGRVTDESLFQFLYFDKQTLSYHRATAEVLGGHFKVLFGTQQLRDPKEPFSPHSLYKLMDIAPHEDRLYYMFDFSSEEETRDAFLILRSVLMQSVLPWFEQTKTRAGYIRDLEHPLSSDFQRHQPAAYADELAIMYAREGNLEKSRAWAQKAQQLFAEQPWAQAAAKECAQFLKALGQGGSAVDKILAEYDQRRA